MLAVGAESQVLLLTALDGQRNIGTTVELPNTPTIKTLVGEPAGFAFIRGWANPSEPWTATTYVVTHLAPDGTYLREDSYTGMGASLSSDRTGLLVGLVVNSRIGDNATSELSLVAGERTEIATTTLQRETKRSCAEDPAKL